MKIKPIDTNRPCPLFKMNSPLKKAYMSDKERSDAENGYIYAEQAQPLSKSKKRYI